MLYQRVLGNREMEVKLGQREIASRRPFLPKNPESKIWSILHLCGQCGLRSVEWYNLLTSIPPNHNAITERSIVSTHGRRSPASSNLYYRFCNTAVQQSDLGRVDGVDATSEKSASSTTSRSIWKSLESTIWSALHTLPKTVRFRKIWRNSLKENKSKMWFHTEEISPKKSGLQIIIRPILNPIVDHAAFRAESFDSLVHLK